MSCVTYLFIILFCEIVLLHSLIMVFFNLNLETGHYQGLLLIEKEATHTEV